MKINCTPLTTHNPNFKLQTIWSLWRRACDVFLLGGGVGGKQAFCHESYQPIPTMQTYVPLLLVEHTSFSFSTGSVWGRGGYMVLQLCLFIIWVWSKISHHNPIYTSIPAFPFCPELCLPHFLVPNLKSVSCQIVINCYLNGNILAI